MLQSVITGFTPAFTPPENSSPLLTINDIEPTLYLEEQNPLHVEPESAQLFNKAYQSIFEPGLRYPNQDQSKQQVKPSSPDQQHASTSMTELLHSPAVLKDGSTQVNTPPELQHASTSMRELIDDDDAPTVAATESDTEDIPLLTQSVEHIREMNNMKNVMLTQLMQDNIDLLESKVQSRKRALQVMEELFEARIQTEPKNDDMTLELSRIIHLKNKLIQQILRETASLHPHVYSMLLRN